MKYIYENYESYLNHSDCEQQVFLLYLEFTYVKIIEL